MLNERLCLVASIEDRASKIGEHWPIGANACSASTAWKGLPGDQSLNPFAAVSGSISRMNADWTIKPKKRENRFGDVAGLPYAGMSPRFSRLRAIAVSAWRYITQPLPPNELIVDG